MIRGEEFEAAVLRALGVQDPPIKAWADAYRALSLHLTEDREERLRSPTGLATDPATLAVAGIIFAARTFQVAQRIFARYPPTGPSFLEVGAGWGPMGAAAAFAGVPHVRLLDRGARPLALARELFNALGLPEPESIVGDGRRLAGGSSLAFPFSLNEMLASTEASERPRAGAELIGRLLTGLPAGARLYVLEPGLKATSRVLQKIRDELSPRAAILAPCPSDQPCPLLARPDDWCHFRWEVELGPVARAVCAHAERHHREVNVAWLVLEREKPASPEAALARVLEVRWRGKGRVELSVCTTRGQAHRLVVLPRTDELRQLVGRLEPGVRAAIDLTRFEPRGDGLHLTAAEGLRLLPD